MDETQPAATVMNMVVSHWSANAAVLAVVAAVCAVHLCGLHGMAADARRGGDMPRGLGREVAAFYGGLFVVVLALLSPLAYWSAYYIWVNGQQVGYSEDSKLPSEFALTKYVKPGKNTIAIELYRWADGSYLEDQVLAEGQTVDVIQIEGATALVAE